MLSSKTNVLLTHTLASFWRKQFCKGWFGFHTIKQGMCARNKHIKHEYVITNPTMLWLVINHPCHILGIWHILIKQQNAVFGNQEGIHMQINGKICFVQIISRPFPFYHKVSLFATNDPTFAAGEASVHCNWLHDLKIRVMDYLG